MTHPIGRFDVYHNPVGPELKELGHEISISDFAAAIEIVRQTGGRPETFWDDVISLASNGRAFLSPLQRPHLKQWIVDNKRLLCGEYSKRAIVTLNHLLESL